MELALIGITTFPCGLTTVTRQIKKYLEENRFRFRYYGAYSNLSSILRKPPYVIFIVSNWYYNIYLLEDFLRTIYPKCRIVGYVVSEGRTPLCMVDIFRWFDTIIVPSRHAFKFIRRVFDGELLIVPHGVDTHLFRPTVEWEKKPFDVCVVFPFPSGVLKRKGYDITLKVLQKTKVKTISNKILPLPNVESLGYLPYDKMFELYNKAKFLLFTSRGEGFGLIPLESMSCGTPIIYSDAPAHNEFAVGFKVPVSTCRETSDIPPVRYCAYNSYPEDYIPYIEKIPVIDEELSCKAREKAEQYDYRYLYDELMLNVLI